MLHPCCSLWCWGYCWDSLVAGALFGGLSRWVQQQGAWHSMTIISLHSSPSKKYRWRIITQVMFSRCSTYCTNAMHMLLDQNFESLNFLDEVKSLVSQGSFFKERNDVSMSKSRRTTLSLANQPEHVRNNQKQFRRVKCYYCFADYRCNIFFERDIIYIYIYMVYI